MKFIAEMYRKTGSLHHAYLLEGSGEQLFSELLAFIEIELQQPTQGNPDLWHERVETFTIDNARIIQQRQNSKALGNHKKIFILEIQFITVEAQNSLLKIFEEPNINTHFFIISPTAEVFLPTVRSRLFIIQNHSKKNEQQLHIQELITTYMAATIPQRFKLLGALIEEKDKTRAINFIDGILAWLHSIQYRDTFVLTELLRNREYLNDRSPSVKLLLEHSALIIPQMSH